MGSPPRALLADIVMPLQKYSQMRSFVRHGTSYRHCADDILCAVEKNADVSHTPHV